MDEFLELKIPVGKTAKLVFDWLKINGSGVFDTMRVGM